MAASYPSNVVEFSSKANLVDVIVADHVNRLQEEVTAVQSSLSADPTDHGTVLDSAYTGAFAQTASWGDLQLRLLNIEGGLVNGVSAAPYVRTDKGSTITAGTGETALTINGASGQDVLTTKLSGVQKFRVDSSGAPKMGTAEVLYVGSTTTTSLQSQITSTAASLAAQINPLMLIG